MGSEGSFPLFFFLCFLFASLFFVLVVFLLILLGQEQATAIYWKKGEFHNPFQNFPTLGWYAASIIAELLGLHHAQALFVDRQTNGETDTKTHREGGSRAERQTRRQASRHIDRDRDRQSRSCNRCQYQSQIARTPTERLVFGQEITARNRKLLAIFHRTLRSQCGIALSCLRERAVSGTHKAIAIAHRSFDTDRWTDRLEAKQANR